MTLALLKSRTAAALRDAGDDGLRGPAVAQVAGRWWERVIHALRRDGYVIIDQWGVYYLVEEPGAEGAREHGRDADIETFVEGCLTGTLSAVPDRLFDPPARSAYASEAA